MIDAALAIQKAVYGRLMADPFVQGELGDPARVYDDPPDDAPLPYLTIGESKLRPIAGVEGALEHDLRIYAYSKYAGRREVKRILAVVHDALHDATLSMPDHQLISLRFVFSDAFRRIDGETYQAVARFRAVTQPI